jgi:hypothetical protein
MYIFYSLTWIITFLVGMHLGQQLARHTLAFWTTILLADLVQRPEQIFQWVTTPRLEFPLNQERSETYIVTPDIFKVETLGQGV